MYHIKSSEKPTQIRNKAVMETRGGHINLANIRQKSNPMPDSVPKNETRSVLGSHRIGRTKHTQCLDREAQCYHPRIIGDNFLQPSQPPWLPSSLLGFGGNDNCVVYNSHT